MRILLLEDHPCLAEAISNHMKLKGFCVDVMSNIKNAEAALQMGNFDAMLLDLSLPDGDGLNFLGKIRHQGNHLPVIIMTARDQVSFRILGLEAGADDYVVKPFDLNELVARLHAVLRRYGGNPNPVVRFGKIEVDYNGHRVSLEGTDTELTAKEWALFEKLILRPGAIIGKEQLEATLYNFDAEISSNTLEVYISRIRKKLGRETIQTIRGLGYRFNGK